MDVLLLKIRNYHKLPRYRKTYTVKEKQLKEDKVPSLIPLRSAFWSWTGSPGSVGAVSMSAMSDKSPGSKGLPSKPGKVGQKVDSEEGTPETGATAGGVVGSGAAGTEGATGTGAGGGDTPPLVFLAIWAKLSSNTFARSWAALSVATSLAEGPNLGKMEEQIGQQKVGQTCWKNTIHDKKRSKELGLCLRVGSLSQTFDQSLGKHLFLALQQGVQGTHCAWSCWCCLCHHLGTRNFWSSSFRCRLDFPSFRLVLLLGLLNVFYYCFFFFYFLFSHIFLPCFLSTQGNRWCLLGLVAIALTFLGLSPFGLLLLFVVSSRRLILLCLVFCLLFLA